MAGKEQSPVIEPVDDEKAPAADSAHVEHSLKAGLSYDEATLVRDFPQDQHNKAFRKIDLRLMPMLMSLYLVANLDR